MGTTGDYRPLTFREADGGYWGFCIEVAQAIAGEMGVMVNPGGLNEKFARERLTHATLVVHPKNEEIPTLIAEGEADVMITEITEAPYYVGTDSRLAAPLLEQPFTRGEIGVLMRRGQEALLEQVNRTIRRMKADGTLRRLHEKYGLRYAY